MKIEQYAKLWNLSEVEHEENHPKSHITNCYSDKYGPCVLKTDVFPNEINTVCRILKEYNGKRFCKLFEADMRNGVLLIERILPGTRLRAETNLDKRLNLFCELIQGLHNKPAEKAAYPTYMDWISRITKYMEQCKEYVFLYEKMAKAESICRSLCEKYSGEMLLHGDLHHDNIVLGENNQYRVIDPKGAVGDFVFDIPRFILNEFDDTMDDNFHRKYIHIIKIMAKRLNISNEDIKRLVYAEMCMAHYWNIESGEEPKIDHVIFTEKAMEAE